jgi:hypothetical protein
MEFNEQGITKYVLMNKNTPVLEFLFDDELQGERVDKITKIFNEEYAPLGVRAGGQISKLGLNEWWRDRLIPISRESLRHSTDLISGFPKGKIQMRVIYDIAQKNHWLSLSDQYWIREVGREDTLEWKDINFFDNDFSDELGKVFLNPHAHIDSRKLNLRSPNAAVGGNLLKAWKIVGDDKKRCLFKGEESQTSRVPYNEVVATRLYERLLNKNEFVQYWAMESNEHIYSVCENMIESNSELVPAAQVLSLAKHKRDSDYVAYTKTCNDFGIDDIEISLSKMLALDFIIANEDRHFNNFGLIRNVETLEYRIAPIFDNGNSLFYLRENTKNISSLRYESKPFRNDPIRQFEKYVTDISWYDPGKVVGFAEEAKSEFAKSPFYRYHDEVVELICEGIDRRIEIVNNKFKELAPVQVSLLPPKRSR